MRVYEVHDYNGLDGIRLAERPIPRPGPKQALVKVRFAALNNRDLVVLRGLHGRDRDPNLIPLGDGAGEVVEVGAETTRVRVGDRVCGAFYQDWTSGRPTEAQLRSSLGGDLDGMLAEFILLSEDGLVLVPGNLDLKQAATLPCAAVTAWSALNSIRSLQKDETVLILGTSSVSLFAVQFASARGAKVIVTTSSEEKAARVKALGADVTINYAKVGDWHVNVMDVTNGEGADLVLDTGGANTLDKSLQAVAIGGSVAVIGFLGGAGLVDPRRLVARQIRTQGMGVGSRDAFEMMNRSIEDHSISPVIDRAFDFNDAVDAYRYFGSKQHFGKVVIAIR